MACDIVSRLERAADMMLFRVIRYGPGAFGIAGGLSFQRCAFARISHDKIDLQAGIPMKIFFKGFFRVGRIFSKGLLMRDTLSVTLKRSLGAVSSSRKRMGTSCGGLVLQKGIAQALSG